MPKFSLAGAGALAGATIIAAGFLSGFALTRDAGGGPCESPVAAGKASSLVSIVDQTDGTEGVSFPTPLKTTGRELSVLSEGSGQPAYRGGYVDFHVNVYSGADLEYLTGSSFEPRNPVRRLVGPDGEDFFGTVLECALPGSRLAITTTVEDIFGQIEEDETLTNQSTVVAVVDVYNTYPARISGGTRLLPVSGMPTVVATADGAHGLSFPNAPIPTDLVVSVLVRGTGPAIAEGDFVTAHFTGAVWETRQVFVSSYEQGIALSLTASDITATPDGPGVVPGIHQALIGLPVGSRVVVSIPPELGYEPGFAPAGVPDGATILYVFDILGVTR